MAAITITIGCIVWLAVPSLCLWVIIYAVRTGQALARGGKYSREKEPIFFWLTMSAYAALLVFWLGMSAYIGFDIFRPR